MANKEMQHFASSHEIFSDNTNSTQTLYVVLRKHVHAHCKNNGKNEINYIHIISTTMILEKDNLYIHFTKFISDKQILF